MRRVGPIAAVLAAAIAGCTPPSPVLVQGDPAPVTVAPTGTAPAPTRQPGSPTPVGVPQLPTGYQGLELAGDGVTVRLPVPSGWLRRPIKPRPGAAGMEFIDPSGLQLFRMEITERDGDRTARQGFETYEPTVQLRNYSRLAVFDVPGVGESAVDWSFTFDGSDGRRQVVDRMVVQGPAGVAVYYRTVQRDFDRLVPIWRYAVGRLVIDSG